MTDRMNDNALPHHFELDHVDYLSVFKDFDEGFIITDTAGEIVNDNEAMVKIDDLDPGDASTEVYDLTTVNPVNCAAIPENQLEGILFGTSKALESPGSCCIIK
jgi:transcriptional regulator with PAS, ATPase and Fis domain